MATMSLRERTSASLGASSYTSQFCAATPRHLSHGSSYTFVHARCHALLAHSPCPACSPHRAVYPPPCLHCRFGSTRAETRHFNPQIIHNHSKEDATRLQSSVYRVHSQLKQLPFDENTRRGDTLLKDGLTETQKMSAVIGVGQAPSNIESVGTKDAFVKVKPEHMAPGAMDELRKAHPALGWEFFVRGGSE